jgi:arylsulfatase A-like enzyme
MFGRLIIGAVVVLITGCSGADPGVIALARHPELATAISVPDSSRPKGAPTKGPYSVRGKFQRLRDDGQTAEYSMRMPFRTVFYTKHTRKQPPEMSLRYKGKQLGFRAQSSKVGPTRTWGYDKGRIIVRLPASEPPPAMVQMGFPMARLAEEALNMNTASLSSEDFVFRSLPLSDSVAHGIFLPAPASLSFDLRVPEGGELVLDAYLLRPAVPAVLKSDGAKLFIEVETRWSRKRVAEISLEVSRDKPVRVDLSGYEGRKISLHLQTVPGRTPRFDYVFLKEPILRSPKSDSKRLLIAFIDTLRPDHMGVYGYERRTTPILDKWAEGAAVFENARAPTPWTLPSARSALSGNLPENIGQGEHLGEILASAGWVSVSLVSNSWLTGDFGLRDGWTSHSARLASSAAAQVDAALEVLEENKRRDVALMVHFIDPHLPYLEPRKYHGVFAGKPPAVLPDRVDSSLVLAAWDKVAAEDRDALKDYVVARYDQNIHYVDAQLGRLLDAMGPEATVVVFSDHGEEFWEHGGFEHGHTLYDELLRVPLMIRAPGLKPSRIDEPTSLIDITPTVLELLGLEALPLDGRSLVPLLRGESSGWGSRTLTFGGNLFGDLAWAVLSDGQKWMVDGGRQHRYDLQVDPGELEDLGPPPADLAAELRGRYLAATGRALHPFVRVAAAGNNRTWAGSPTVLTISSDASFKSAFGAIHPVGDFLQPVVTTDGIELRKSGSRRMPREFFLQPERAADQGLSLSMELESATGTQRVEVDLSPLGLDFQPLSSGEYRNRALEVGWTWMPEPADLKLAEPGSDTTEALRELGYLE